MPRSTIPILLTLAAGLAILLPASPAIAQACYEETQVACCKAANAKLSIECKHGDSKWVCHSAPTANPVITVTRPAKNGKKFSTVTGHDVCEFKKPTCGDTLGSCGTQSTNTKLTCDIEEASGADCQTPSYLLSASGEVPWDLNFVLAVDGSPFEFNLGSGTCGGGGEPLVP